MGSRKRSRDPDVQSVKPKTMKKHVLMKWKLLLAVIVALCAQPVCAFALELRVRNDFNNRMVFAVVHFDAQAQKWRTRGWWNVDPHSERTMNFPGSDIYIHAQLSGTTMTWGDEITRTVIGNAFSYFDGEVCPEGRNRREVKFTKYTAQNNVVEFAPKPAASSAPAAPLEIAGGETSQTPSGGGARLIGMEQRQKIEGTTEIRFTPEKSGVWEFRTVDRDDCDPILRIYNSDRKHIGWNDDSAGNRNALLIIPLAGGKEYILSAGFQSNEGQYFLEAKEISAVELQVGSMAVDGISIFSFTPLSSATWEFFTTDSGGSDLRLYLYDSNSNLLTAGNSSADKPNVRITASCAEGETYYILAWNRNGPTVKCTLHAELSASAPVSAPAATPAPVAATTPAPAPTSTTTSTTPSAGLSARAFAGTGAVRLTDRRELAALGEIAFARPGRALTEEERKIFAGTTCPG